MTTGESVGPGTPAMRHGPALIARVGLLLAFLTAALITPADADLWGHLTFGKDIVSSGSPIQVDQYSFTSDRPWVNHEWLTEVILFSVYRRGGPVGLIALKLSVIATLVTIVWRYFRRVGAPLLLRLSAVSAVFVGTYWRTHNLRPQLFSVLLFAIVLVTMKDAEHGRRRGLFLVPALMALWVNLHGGWIVGFGMLGFWAAFRVVRGDVSLTERLTLTIFIAVSAAATLLTPDGIEMWRFLAETVRLGREDIEEWGSIFTSPLALGVPWALMLGIAVWAVWKSGRPYRVDRLAIVALLAVASVRVSRLDAFFALTVVILLSDEIARAWSAGAAVALPADPAVVPRGIMAVTAITAVGMMVPVAVIVRPYTTCLTMTGGWLPEADAASFVELNHLRGRMLTWFDWGEYAIWHFSPDLQVSMDGRRETVYTDRNIQAHRAFYAAHETGAPLVRALNPDYIWIPGRLAAAQQLRADGWVPVFQGPVSVIFAKTGAGPFHDVAPATRVPRCFPGP